MAECNVWDCRKEATRILIVALETSGGACKVNLLACTGHGDELDEHRGMQYLVTDSRTYDN